MASDSPVRRAILLVLDGVGAGALPDADSYGDAGSDTLGNVARRRALDIPALRTLGLGRVARLGGPPPPADPDAAFGLMAERSAGKDSVTGHWELTGVVLDQPFPVFPDGFPPSMIAEFERRIGRATIGNRAASGTRILEELGALHLETGSPIVYTSADSVFQIAAHEELVPPDELYRWCEVAYALACEGLGVGRVIARPFVGRPGSFSRTVRRRDFARPPDGVTLLDRAAAAGLPVITVGKVDHLFAGRGVTSAIHTGSDDETMDGVEETLSRDGRAVIFANLVDFDTQYGHRNDVDGFVANLERFDARLSELLPRLTVDDLLIITADHGNDPTTPSTDHSREYVPLLVTGPAVRRGVDLGVRSTFADVGQTIAEAFGLPSLASGTSFFDDLF